MILHTQDCFSCVLAHATRVLRLSFVALTSSLPHSSAYLFRATFCTATWSSSRLLFALLMASLQPHHC